MNGIRSEFTNGRMEWVIRVFHYPTITINPHIYYYELHRTTREIKEPYDFILRW
jgi:hypothetical protein